MTWKSVRVDQLLQESLEGLAHTALAGVEIDLEADGQPHAAIVDESMLRHLITLVVMTCAKLCRPLGVLHVRVGRSESFPESDAWIGVATDSWIGITFLANGSSAKPALAAADGAQLEEHSQSYWEDLAQASTLARFLGGRLIARHSDKGLGPIAVYLPPAQIVVQPLPLAPIRILVLDDNAETRWAMSEVLRRAGFDVMEAATAQEVRRHAEDRQGKVHLILGDLLLPVPQGVSLLLEASSMLGGAPVLLATGRKLGEEVRAWLTTMGVRWMQKPFNSEGLLRCVQAILAEGP